MAAVHAVKARMPEGAELMVDYNQALSVDEALERGRALDGEGLALIEEPIRHDDYAGAARLARELATPIKSERTSRSPSRWTKRCGRKRATT